MGIQHRHLRTARSIAGTGTEKFGGTISCERVCNFYSAHIHIRHVEQHGHLPSPSRSGRWRRTPTRQEGLENTLLRLTHPTSIFEVILVEVNVAIRCSFPGPGYDGEGSPDYFLVSNDSQQPRGSVFPSRKLSTGLVNHIYQLISHDGRGDVPSGRYISSGSPFGPCERLLPRRQQVDSRVLVCRGTPQSTHQSSDPELGCRVLRCHEI